MFEFLSCMGTSNGLDSTQTTGVKSTLLELPERPAKATSGHGSRSLPLRLLRVHTATLPRSTTAACERRPSCQRAFVRHPHDPHFPRNPPKFTPVSRGV